MPDFVITREGGEQSYNISSRGGIRKGNVLEKKDLLEDFDFDSKSVGSRKENVKSPSARSESSRRTAILKETYPEPEIKTSSYDESQENMYTEPRVEIPKVSDYYTDLSLLANEEKVREESEHGGMDRVSHGSRRASEPEETVDYTNMYQPSEGEMDRIFQDNDSYARRSQSPSSFKLPDSGSDFSSIGSHRRESKKRVRRKRYDSETDLESELSVNEDEEKAYLIHVLKKFSQNKNLHINPRVLHMDVPLRALKKEYLLVTKSISIENSIRFQENSLIMACTFLENANEKYNPFDFSLKGWSDQIYDSKENFSGVFEEIHKKYGSKVEGIDPILKLGLMLAGSATMYARSVNSHKKKLDQKKEFDQEKEIEQNTGKRPTKSKEELDAMIQNTLQKIKKTQEEAENGQKSTETEESESGDETDRSKRSYADSVDMGSQNTGRSGTETEVSLSEYESESEKETVPAPQPVKRAPKGNKKRTILRIPRN